MDISITITSSLTNSERRVSLQWTIQYLQQRLETITGIPPLAQQLLLFPSPASTESIDISTSNTNTPLSTLSLKEGSRIHVNDTREDSELKALEDESNVKFFELDEKEYDERANTVRRWKQDNKLGRFAPEYQSKLEEMKQLNKTRASTMSVGERFRTVNDPLGERRGVIRYLGKVKEIDDGNNNDMVWCGVQFDEPVGKNNGSINGVYYFHAEKNYGGFLKPQQLETGDFPEVSLFSDDDEI